MNRVFNFSAGPAMLPTEVLAQAQAELLDWHNSGMSVMEIGHRGAEYQAMADQAEQDLRELLSIPEHYAVLFLAGGASTQFAMVPLNLFARGKVADYVDTGIWSKKAIAEAKRYGEVTIAATASTKDGLIHVPTEWDINPKASYLHFTPNETIEGIEIPWVPKTNIPLVVDMTSVILSKPINVNDYGVIYAGAQKNIGQAGLNVVIIRKELIQDPLPSTPTLYSYKIQAENKSFYNTPPTFAWYIAGLVFAWMKRQGGVAVFAERNQRKAEKLYAMIDGSEGFYKNPVHPENRSRMNVPFNLQNSALTDVFLKASHEAGLTNLKGHRLAGPGSLRASIYNAVPEAGVDALVDFMRDFKKKYG